uniref:START domain-containing protein n=1 Tax=Setaria italica TaxID=4555 RepID=K3YDE0_SETIT
MSLLRRHQISHALFQVLWIVHAEYDDTAVPPLFRQLFQSGQALGAIRWLTSLQRQCEYMAILRSSQVPSSVVSGVAMSMLGRRSILALAQRMMASFYTAVSEPITLKPGNIVKEWRGSCGTATELSEATVRMVLSATMTVWLPGTPPQRVHEYLCNEQRRGEWDTFANTGAVQELTSVITHPYLRGNNVVSVLEARDVPDQTNSNMLIMQEATSDVSCSLLVYSSIERNLIHAVMNGGDNTSIYLLPSGFAILPDGHGKTHRAAAASSSSAPTGHNGTAGSLLTAAYQALLPNNPSNHEAGTFNNAGNRVCNAINQILAAIGADIAVPS